MWVCVCIRVGEEAQNGFLITSLKGLWIMNLSQWMSLGVGAKWERDSFFSRFLENDRKEGQWSAANICVCVSAWVGYVEVWFRIKPIKDRQKTTTKKQQMIETEKHHSTSIWETEQLVKSCLIIKHSFSVIRPLTCSMFTKSDYITQYYLNTKWP